MKLCYPVNYVGITGPFTAQHPAIDLGWYKTQNVPILACFNGIVTRIYDDETYGGGLTMVIKYDNGYTSYFKHLSRTISKVGDKVIQMQEVAIMGNSGWSTTGTHLHFILYKNNKIVNPIEHCYLYPNQQVSEKDKDIVMYYEGGGDMKFKVGDKVIINGNLYNSSNANIPSGKVENKITTITRVVEGTLHPYNTTDDLGWMNESDIKFYEEPTTYYKQLYETELEKNRKLQQELSVSNEKISAAINILQ